MSTFGIRPEAIKLYALVRDLQKHLRIESGACLTGQQQILDQITETFDVKVEEKIYRETATLPTSHPQYDDMAQNVNPCGDGDVSARIVR